MRDYTKDSSKEQGAKREGLARLRPRRPHWRFEDLEIWNRAAELAVKFHRIADCLDTRRLYRYAEQLRAAGLSLSKNITRRSLFEDASMLLVFERLGLLESGQVDELLWDCDEASRKITNFSRAL